MAKPAGARRTATTSTRHRWALGLDIGGTFTDVMMVDLATRRSVRYKTLTTPSDPAIGALDAVEGVLREAATTAAEVEVLLHATTLVSNALIERKGAPTALVATRGFKDMLDIAREKKFDIYDLMLDKPAPLVPPARRFEVAERIAADGSEIAPLGEESVAELVRAVRASGATAVAVCLLHAYMNPEHERTLRSRLQSALPGVAICISSDVLPEMREYERASTTVANAYVQPLTAGYLDRFAQGLRSRGLACPMFVMLSEGALAAPEVVKRVPVRICESGPAAGAVISAAVARQLERKHVLSFDMGGTTAKTCIVHDGEPQVTSDFEVARIYRFKKGSGLPLRVPVVDLIEIGAGGGSLVHVDAFGLLKVGPESAAADPGPACYGRGGTRATVTDADLVLGYLGADSFLGGRMRLDVDRARAAIAADAGRHLRGDVEHAALGIHEVVNENMAGAARVQVAERGHDPSGHALVAFGGAGPVHAWGVASKLGVRTIVVPPSPGVGSAFGLLLAPRAFHLSRTYIGTLDALGWPAVRGAYEDMETAATEALASAGVRRADIHFIRSADMRYLGQRKEIVVDLGTQRLDAGREAILREQFERRYEALYHRRHAGHPVEVLCWRLAATGPQIMRLPAAPGRPTAGARTRRATPVGARPMLFAGWKTYRTSPVYRRDGLVAGDALAGPAVIEDDESSTVVGPGGAARVDAFGNLVVTTRRSA